MEIPVIVETAAPLIVESVVPLVVESVAPPIVDAPLTLDTPLALDAPLALDGGAKPRSKTRKPRSKTRKSMSKKSKSKKRSPKRKHGMYGGDLSGGDLSGGVFGYDAFGDRDLGGFPKKKNLPYSGLSRNEDYDAINKNLSNPAYKSAEDSYMQLHKLYMQMSKTRMSEANKIKLLEEVKSHNEQLTDGEEPEWLTTYIKAIDEKIEETEQAIKDKKKTLATSLEYQAAIEEKKLAYMIMEYLSGVSVGSGERSRNWRSERTRTGQTPSIYRNVKGAYTAPAAAEAAEAEAEAAAPQAAANPAAAPQAAAAAANPSLGILNTLSLGVLGEPSAAQIQARAAAARAEAAAAAQAQAQAARIQAEAERDARQRRLAQAAAAQAAAAQAAASPAAPAAAGPVAAVLNTLGSVLGSGSASAAAPASNEQFLEERRLAQDARIAASSRSPINLISASGSPINLISGSPAAAAASRVAEAVEAARDRLALAPRRQYNTRANPPGSGLRSGLGGGAKRSKSRSKKAKSRSHKKTKKHSK